MAKIVAISPSSLSVAGGHGGDAGRVGDRLLERRQLPPRSPARPSACRRRAGTGRSSRDRTPRSAGRRRPAACATPAGCRRRAGRCASAVTGNAKISRTTTPAAIDAHGRRVTNSPQRVNAGETWACSGFFGTSRRPKAPIMIGRIVSADTTTAPIGDRGAEAHLADERDADHEQAGDRHHHDQPGGDDGRAGGRRRAGGGVLHAVAGRPLLAVAADDQQRVVDPRAEAEHHREHGGEGREARAAPTPRPAGSAPPRRPISAPMSVAAIAAPERNSRVSSTIAMSTPTSSPMGASCSAARSIRIAARLDLDLGLGRLAGGDQRLAVLLVDLPRPSE